MMQVVSLNAVALLAVISSSIYNMPMARLSVHKCMAVMLFRTVSLPVYVFDVASFYSVASCHLTVFGVTEDGNGRLLDISVLLLCSNSQSSPQSMYVSTWKSTLPMPQMSLHLRTFLNS